MTGGLCVIDLMERDELPLQVHEAIRHFCTDGDRLANEREFEAAIAEYSSAWELLPEPKNQWNAATWILAAIADAAFLGGYKTSARDALDYVMTCPQAIGNPVLHLRRGQVLLDAGCEDAAADELMRAYMGGGLEIFEEEDPHYFAFLSDRAMLN